jgi:hypothetical protein
VNECILDLAFELICQAANECVSSGRRVVTPNDMTRAIDRVRNVNTAPRWLMVERGSRVRAEYGRVARFQWRPRPRRHERRGASTQARLEEAPPDTPARR